MKTIGTKELALTLGYPGVNGPFREFLRRAAISPMGLTRGIYDITHVLYQLDALRGNKFGNMIKEGSGMQHLSGLDDANEIRRLRHTLRHLVDTVTVDGYLTISETFPTFYGSDWDDIISGESIPRPLMLPE